MSITILFFSFMPAVRLRMVFPAVVTTVLPFRSGKGNLDPGAFLHQETRSMMRIVFRKEKAPPVFSIQIVSWSSNPLRYRPAILHKRGIRFPDVPSHLPPEDSAQTEFYDGVDHDRG